MTYKRKIEFKEEYVQVNLNGEIDAKNELETWKKIREECEKYKCYNVLGITGKNVSPYTIIDAYEYPKIFEKAGIDSKYRIAWVNKDPKVYNLGKFAVNVMKNQEAGYSCQTFLYVSDAKKWLLKK